MGISKVEGRGGGRVTETERRGCSSRESKVRGQRGKGRHCEVKGKKSYGTKYKVKGSSGRRQSELKERRARGDRVS